MRRSHTWQIFPHGTHSEGCNSRCSRNVIISRFQRTFVVASALPKDGHGLCERCKRTVSIYDGLNVLGERCIFTATLANG